MMTAPISPEAIEATARALLKWEVDSQPSFKKRRWTQLDVDERTDFTDCAEAVLQAAFPHLTAAIVDPVLNECAQIANVREYGEYGTPFYNGARHLSNRIRLVIKQMTP